MNNSIPLAQIQQAKQRQRIVGNAPALNRAIEVALLIAPTDVNVLVIGESGVGKESFPQIIHQNSIRKHGACISVNCGAIPEGTIDSELFGHKKGAFTDAVTERKGYFEEANGGTIFLDEVGELPLPTQARLLRVLESGEFMKVGSSQVQRTDIRVVAATNVDLEEAIAKGKFRQDLYYRLNTVTINLPPLRERGDDSLLLFRLFASDFADKYHMPPIHLSDEAKEIVLKYHWPGNIRELKNLAERLSVIAEERVISAQLITESLPRITEHHYPALVSSFTNHSDPIFGAREYNHLENMPAQVNSIYGIVKDIKGNISELTNLLCHLLHSGYHSATTFHSSLPASPTYPDVPEKEYGSVPLTTPVHTLDVVHRSETNSEIEFQELLDEGKVLSLDEMEKRYIEMVLQKNNGARKKTAEDLNISERTLYRKLKYNDFE